jgi:hypothetical protein
LSPSATAINGSAHSATIPALVIRKLGLFLLNKPMIALQMFMNVAKAGCSMAALEQRIAAAAALL